MNNLTYRACENIAHSSKVMGCTDLVDSLVDPASCLASKLWKPFHYVVFNPVYSVVVLLVVYIVFVIVFLPFWLASWFMGSWGSVGCLLYLLVWGCRAFARTMSFPGASKSLQRDFSLDFMKRTISQMNTFNTLASNFAVTVANSKKMRGKLHGDGTGGKQDPIERKAVELEGWVLAMTTMHSYLSDAIEDYRYMAYKQAAGENGSGTNRLGPGAHSGRAGTSSGGLGSNSISTNLARGAVFTWQSITSVRGWNRVAEKASDRLLSSLNLCTGKTPVTKEEINEVLNPAIVVRDSFGSLLEHTGTLLCALNRPDSELPGLSGEARADKEFRIAGTPPRRKRNLSASGDSQASSIAEIVASISMVIRYGEQLRNALGYMLVQSEHDDEKRKEMSTKLNAVSSGGHAAGMDTEGAEEGVDSLLETGSGPSVGSYFIASSLSKLAPNSPLVSSFANLNVGSRGPANLSFFMMRSQLVTQYQAHRFSVLGCDDNNIDCIYIPAGTGSSGHGINDDNDKNRSSCSSNSHSCDDGDSDVDGDDEAASAVFGDDRTKALLQSDPRGGDQQYLQSQALPVATKEADDERAVLLDMVGKTDCSTYGAAGSPDAKGKKKARSASLPPMSQPDVLSPPPRDRPRTLSSGYHSTVQKPTISPVGTVLFCGPNAGMYESFSMANEEASWLGYYTSLGLDVVFFNYRGYNLSTGRPSPEGVQTDGIFVLEHLKEKFGVRDVILHGESIGGMVATHIARHFDCSLTPPSPGPTPSPSFTDLSDVESGNRLPNASSTGGTFTIKMLVCDRTFASLDAVAARFLGTWAAYGLKYLGPWHTDCVTPYLESDVTMKVIIQDPDDSIINHAASLKNATATYALTREREWLPRKAADKDYRVAILQNKAPVLPSAVTSEPFHFNQAFIEAMCVSIISLAQRAQTSPDEGREEGDADLAETIDGLVHGRGRNFDNKKSLPFRTYRPSYEWIRSFCSQSVEARNKNLTPLDKVLAVLFSLDGRTGQVLGEALGGGYDDLYPFFCALVLWSPRSFGSSRTVSRSAAHSFRSFSRNIHRVCEELDNIVTEERSSSRSGLDQDELLVFLRRALGFCREKILQSASTGASPGAGGVTLSSAPSLFSPPRSRSISGDKSNIAATGVKLSILEDNQQYRGTSSMVGESRPINDGVEGGDWGSAPVSGGPGGAGYVINVDCGHSGWPSSRALDSLTSCMVEAGIEVKTV